MFGNFISFNHDHGNNKKNIRKMKNKPLIGAILTMVGIYLLISFAIWDLNAKHWPTELRGMYSFFSPIFAGLAYSAIRQFTIK